MAKAATAKSNSDKKKKKSAGGSADQNKARKAKPGKADKKAGGKSKAREGFDGLAKLVDHPLVADLLAAGALAAVAAIAEHQMGKNKGETSSKMVKSAGKAAATAMGKKLIDGFGEVTSAAADAAKKA